MEVLLHQTMDLEILRHLLCIVPTSFQEDQQFRLSLTQSFYCMFLLQFCFSLQLIPLQTWRNGQSRKRRKQLNTINMCKRGLVDVILDRLLFVSIVLPCNKKDYIII